MKISELLLQFTITELQIRKGNRGNLGIIFLIFH